MKIRLAGILLLCPFLLSAQTANTEPPQPENVVKIVRVHGNAQSIGSLAASWSGIHYQVSDALKAIVLTGKPADVARVERTIQELDALNATTPPAAATERNMETTVYVISGSAELISGVQEITGEALAPVVKQLRAIFPYNHYQLLSTMLIRSAQNAKASTEGIMTTAQSNSAPGRPSAYKISYDSARTSGDLSPSIHLAAFRFETSVVIASQFQQVAIQTDVDLHEGQKVVVGRANVGNSDACIFLVLSARLVP